MIVVPDLLFFEKRSGLELSLNVFDSSEPSIQRKQTVKRNYLSRYMLNFDFLEKGLGIVSPPHFVYDFSSYMFLMLYSINGPNFIS